jgi:Uma2 family endonuclease
MGMPASLRKQWTYEMLESFPEDGKRYEIIDGELHVSPSPQLPHQIAIWRLVVLIDAYVTTHPAWFGVIAPSDVVFNNRNVVEPDVFIVRRQGNEERELVDPSTMLLAIEVISLSTSRYDRVEKRKLYQRFAVPNYWIIDPHLRSAERWTPRSIRPDVFTDVIEWQPPSDDPPLRVKIADLFLPRKNQAEQL